MVGSPSQARHVPCCSKHMSLGRLVFQASAHEMNTFPPLFRLSSSCLSLLVQGLQACSISQGASVTHGGHITLAVCGKTGTDSFFLHHDFTHRFVLTKNLDGPWLSLFSSLNLGILPSRLKVPLCGLVMAPQLKSLPLDPMVWTGSPGPREWKERTDAHRVIPGRTHARMHAHTQALNKCKNNERKN